MKRVDIIRDNFIIKSLIFLYNRNNNEELHDLVLNNNSIDLISKFYPTAMIDLELDELLSNKEIEVSIITNLDINNLQIIDLKRIIYAYTDIKITEQCLYTRYNELISVKTNISYEITPEFMLTKDLSPEFNIASLDFTINPDRIINVIDYKDIYPPRIIDFEKDIMEYGTIKLFFPYIYYLHIDYYNDSISNSYLNMSKDLIKMIYDSYYDYVSKKITYDKINLNIKSCVVQVENSKNIKLDMFKIFENMRFSENIYKIEYFTLDQNKAKYDERYLKDIKWKPFIKDSLDIHENMYNESIRLYTTYKNHNSLIIIYDDATVTIYYDFENNIHISHEDIPIYNEKTLDNITALINPILKINKKYFDINDCFILSMVYQFKLNKSSELLNVNDILIDNVIEQLGVLNRMIVKKKYINYGINNYLNMLGIPIKTVIDSVALEDVLYKNSTYSYITHTSSVDINFEISGIKDERELEFCIELILSILYHSLDSGETDLDTQGKQNTKQLTLFDPVTFGKSNNSIIGYSRRCQKKTQPVIATPALLDTLTDEEKKRVFDYINRKTGDMIKYLCPNTSYPYLTLIKGDRFCIPCCAKKKQKQEVFESCIKTGNLPSKEEKTVTSYRYYKNINTQKELENGKLYSHNILTSSYGINFFYVEGKSLLNIFAHILETNRTDLLKKYGIIDYEISDINDTKHDALISGISTNIERSVIIISCEDENDLEGDITLENFGIYDDYIVIYRIKDFNFLVNDTYFGSDRLSNPYDLRFDNKMIQYFLKNIKQNIYFDFGNIEIFIKNSRTYILNEIIISDGFIIAVDVTDIKGERGIIFIKHSNMNFNIKSTTVDLVFKYSPYSFVYNFLNEFNKSFSLNEHIYTIVKKDNTVQGIVYCDIKIPCIDTTLENTKGKRIMIDYDLKDIYNNTFSKGNKFSNKIPDIIIKKKNNGKISIYMYRIIMNVLAKYCSSRKIKNYKLSKETLTGILDDILEYKDKVDYSDFEIENNINTCLKDGKDCFEDKIVVPKKIRESLIEILHYDICKNNALCYFVKNFTNMSTLNRNVFKINKYEKIIIL